MFESLRSWMVMAGGLLALVSPAFAQDAELERQRELLEILRTAPPAPNPPSGIATSPKDSASDTQTTIGFDPESGQSATTLLPNLRSGTNATSPSQSPMTPRPAGDALPGSVAPFPVTPAISALTQIYDTTSMPWSTVDKLLMRFNVGGVDYYYVCSGMAVGQFQVMTAGHCIYNWDPNNDGNTSDRRWASEIWVWAGQTDWSDPVGSPDRLYGEAKGVYLRSYTNWTDSGDFNHDWGVVTLNRRDGNHTGWMGREANVTTSGLNYTGYPVETPYVPAGTNVQYFGYDGNNVQGYSCCVISLSAWIYGGHSGGPSWRYDGSVHYIEGIHSRSDRAGNAYDTLLTEGKFNDLDSYLGDDESTRPPVARPDIIEYFFDGNGRKDLLTNAVEAGGTIDVEYNAFNSGFADSGQFSVDFYLSSDPNISGSDVFLGSESLSLGEYYYANSVATLVVPPSVAPGTYYVGWIYSGGNTEYATGNNSAVIGNETVTVTQPACDADFYEEDGSVFSASSISTFGDAQQHGICPVGDIDWVTFHLDDAASAVTISTSGASGDTRLWLYDSGLNEVDFNDDWGGLFSRIERSCSGSPLQAGDYSVKVDEFQDDETIASYQLTVTASSCCGDGLLQGGEQCDGGACCTPSCTFASGVACRGAVSSCDVAEQCSGLSADCPADGFVSAGTVCRPASSICDAAELCSGSSGICPADTMAPSTKLCRSSSGVCDAGENCSGSSASCPPDGYLPSTILCRSSNGSCDLSENCSGTSASCPINLLRNAGTICRAAVGVCDMSEVCDGSSAACPADGFAGTTSLCRAAVGVCDLAESCSGSSATCPPDNYRSSAATCRSSIGACDLVELCSGSSAACPTDARAGAGTPCRPSSGVCDAAETCNGAGADCPGDLFAASGVVCRGAQGVCDVPEACSGSAASCPTDAFLPSSSVCRSAQGICDVEERCSGSSPQCAVDSLRGAEVSCRPASGICDSAESCSGSLPACPADTVLGSGTVCRASTGSCDDEERCTGSSLSCPAESNTDGRACDTNAFCSTGGVCVARSCSGTARDCGDANPCTTDSCSEAQAACLHTNRAGTCDDGIFCNGADSCAGGSCTEHQGNPCPGPDGDGNCHESCNEAADDCSSKDPENSVCDDGDPCTVGDGCTNGQCAGQHDDGCGVTTTTLVAGVCGDANGDDKITAADALVALRTSVGSGSCPAARCDYNGSGAVTASDALAILKAAVGQPGVANCPADNDSAEAPATSTTTTRPADPLSPNGIDEEPLEP